MPPRMLRKGTGTLIDEYNKLLGQQPTPANFTRLQNIRHTLLARDVWHQDDFGEQELKSYGEAAGFYNNIDALNRPSRGQPKRIADATNPRPAGSYALTGSYRPSYEGPSALTRMGQDIIQAVTGAGIPGLTTPQVIPFEKEGFARIIFQTGSGPGQKVSMDVTPGAFDRWGRSTFMMRYETGATGALPLQAFAKEGGEYEMLTSPFQTVARYTKLALTNEGLRGDFRGDAQKAFNALIYEGRGNLDIPGGRNIEVENERPLRYRYDVSQLAMAYGEDVNREEALANFFERVRVSSVQYARLGLAQKPPAKYTPQEQEIAQFAMFAGYAPVKTSGRVDTLADIFYGQVEDQSGIPGLQAYARGDKLTDEMKRRTIRLGRREADLLTLVEGKVVPLEARPITGIAARESEGYRQASMLGLEAAEPARAMVTTALLAPTMAPGAGIVYQNPFRYEPTPVIAGATRTTKRIDLPEVNLNQLQDMRMELGIMRRTKGGGYKRLRGLEGETLAENRTYTLGWYQLGPEAPVIPIEYTTGGTPETIRGLKQITIPSHMLGNYEPSEGRTPPMGQRALSAAPIAEIMAENLNVPVSATGGQGVAHFDFFMEPWKNISAKGEAGTKIGLSPHPLLQRLGNIMPFQLIPKVKVGGETRQVSMLTNEIKDWTQAFGYSFMFRTPQTQQKWLGELGRMEGMGPTAQALQAAIAQNIAAGTQTSVAQLANVYAESFYGANRPFSGQDAVREQDFYYRELMTKLRSVTEEMAPSKAWRNYGWARLQPQWYQTRVVTAEERQVIEQGLLEGAALEMSQAGLGNILDKEGKLTPEGKIALAERYPEPVGLGVRFTETGNRQAPYAMEMYSEGAILAKLAMSLTAEDLGRQPMKLSPRAMQGLALQWPEAAKALGITPESIPEASVEAGYGVYPRHIRAARTAYGVSRYLASQVGMNIRDTGVSGPRPALPGARVINPEEARNMLARLGELNSRDAPFGYKEELFAEFGDQPWIMGAGVGERKNTPFLPPEVMRQWSYSPFDEKSQYGEPVGELSRRYFRGGVLEDWLREAAGGETSARVTAWESRLMRQFAPGTQNLKNIMRSFTEMGDTGRYSLGIGQGFKIAQISEGQLQRYLQAMGQAGVKAGNIQQDQLGSWYRAAYKQAMDQGFVVGARSRYPQREQESFEFQFLMTPKMLKNRLGLIVPEASRVTPSGRVIAGDPMATGLVSRVGMAGIRAVEDFDMDEMMQMMVELANPQFGKKGQPAYVTPPGWERLLNVSEMEYFEREAAGLAGATGTAANVRGGIFNLIAGTSGAMDYLETIRGKPIGQIKNMTGRTAVPYQQGARTAWDFIKYGKGAMGAEYNMMLDIEASMAILGMSPEAVSREQSALGLHYQTPLDILWEVGRNRGGQSYLQTFLNSAIWGSDITGKTLQLLAITNPGGKHTQLWNESQPDLGGQILPFLTSVAQADWESYQRPTQQGGVSTRPPASMMAGLFASINRPQDIPWITQRFEEEYAKRPERALQRAISGESGYAAYFQEQTGQVYNPMMAPLGFLLATTATQRATVYRPGGKGPRMIQTMNPQGEWVQEATMKAVGGRGFMGMPLREWANQPLVMGLMGLRNIFENQGNVPPELVAPIVQVAEMIQQQGGEVAPEILSVLARFQGQADRAAVQEANKEIEAITPPGLGDPMEVDRTIQVKSIVGQPRPRKGKGTRKATGAGGRGGGGGGKKTTAPAAGEDDEGGGEERGSGMTFAGGAVEGTRARAIQNIADWRQSLDIIRSEPYQGMVENLRQLVGAPAGSEVSDIVTQALLPANRSRTGVWLEENFEQLKSLQAFRATAGRAAGEWRVSDWQVRERAVLKQKQFRKLLEEHPDWSEEEIKLQWASTIGMPNKPEFGETSPQERQALAMVTGLITPTMNSQLEYDRVAIPELARSAELAQSILGQGVARRLITSGGKLLPPQPQYANTKYARMPAEMIAKDRMYMAEGGLLFRMLPREEQQALLQENKEMLEVVQYQRADAFYNAELAREPAGGFKPGTKAFARISGAEEKLVQAKDAMGAAIMASQEGAEKRAKAEQARQEGFIQARSVGRMAGRRASTLARGLTPITPGDIGAAFEEAMAKLDDADAEYDDKIQTLSEKLKNKGLDQALAKVKAKKGTGIARILAGEALEKEAARLVEQELLEPGDLKDVTAITQAAAEQELLPGAREQQTRALGEWRQGGRLGSLARRLFGGFGLMYMRSIAGLVTTGARTGYGERMTLEQQMAQSFLPMGGEMPVTAAEQIQRVAALQYGGQGGILMDQTRLMLMREQQPLYTLATTGLAGVSAGGMALWLGESMNVRGKQLAALGIGTGVTIAAGSQLLNYLGARNDVRGTAISLAVRQAQGEDLNRTAWTSIGVSAATGAVAGGAMTGWANPLGWLGGGVVGLGLGIGSNYQMLAAASSPEIQRETAMIESLMNRGNTSIPAVLQQYGVSANLAPYYAQQLALIESSKPENLGIGLPAWGAAMAYQLGYGAQLGPGGTHDLAKLYQAGVDVPGLAKLTAQLAGMPLSQLYGTDPTRRGILAKVTRPQPVTVTVPYADRYEQAHGMLANIPGEERVTFGDTYRWTPWPQRGAAPTRMDVMEQTLQSWFEKQPFPAIAQEQYQGYLSAISQYGTIGTQLLQRAWGAGTATAGRTPGRDAEEERMLRTRLLGESLGELTATGWGDVYMAQVQTWAARKAQGLTTAAMPLPAEYLGREMDYARQQRQQQLYQLQQILPTQMFGVEQAGMQALGIRVIPATSPIAINQQMAQISFGQGMAETFFQGGATTQQAQQWGGAFAMMDVKNFRDFSSLFGMNPLQQAGVLLQRPDIARSLAQTTGLTGVGGAPLNPYNVGLVDINAQGYPTGMPFGTSNLAKPARVAELMANMPILPGQQGLLPGQRQAAVSQASWEFARQIWGSQAQPGVGGIIEAYATGGQIGVQAYQMERQGYWQMASAGVQMAQLALQERYQPQFWALEDRSRALGYRQQEWNLSQQQRQLDMGQRFWQEGFQMNIAQSQLQRGWTRQDWGYQDLTRNLQWGWKQEDFAENLRFMSGRDRRLAERQMGRDTTMFNLESQQIDKTRERQKELWKLEDQRFDMARRQQMEQLKYQQENIDKQNEFYKEGKKIQEEQVKLQREYWKENMALQKAAAGIAAAAGAEQIDNAKKLKQAADALNAATAEQGLWSPTTITQLAGSFALLNPRFSAFITMVERLQADLGGKDTPCFVENTLVNTPNGLVHIQDIGEGDQVYSYNLKNNSMEIGTVTRAMVHEWYRIVTVETEAGVVQCTPVHRWYTDEGWVQAGSLQVGDQIYMFTETYATVTAVSVEDATEPVYNLTVDNQHNYFVEGHLVHNKVLEAGGGPIQPFETTIVGEQGTELITSQPYMASVMPNNELKARMYDGAFRSAWSNVTVSHAPQYSGVSQTQVINVFIGGELLRSFIVDAVKQDLEVN